MMKAVMIDESGRAVLLIGLSFKNLDKLRAEPLDTFIRINGKETGDLPIDVMVFSGRTEAEMAQSFASFVDGRTKVIIDPKLRDTLG